MMWLVGLIILVAISIYFITTKDDSYDEYKWKTLDYELDENILLIFEIFNADYLAVYSNYHNYIYQINTDGTLKLTITERKLFDNRWDDNTIYENTIKLTQSDIETLKILVEAAFQPEELEKESIFNGAWWGVRVYYKDKFDVAIPYHFEFKRVLFDLVEEILRLGPDDFEGRLVYEEAKDIWRNV